MDEIDVAMVIAREDTGSFLAMRKDLKYTEKDRYMNNPWETAGGKIETGETVPEAAVRELEEETNITGNYVGPEEYPRDEYHVEHLQRDEDGEKLKINFYPVPLEVSNQEPNLVLSKEHDDYEWLSKDDFRDQLPEHNVEGFDKVLEEFI